MFTIYHQPVDLPGAAYVVRRFLIRADAIVPADLLGTGPTLNHARLLVPLSADVCLTRNDTDEPHIVETWV
jgi:hypothetical protein